MALTDSRCGTGQPGVTAATKTAKPAPADSSSEDPETEGNLCLQRRFRHVLDREGSQLCIRHQIAGDLDLCA
jgi:hypothetical protein